MEHVCLFTFCNNVYKFIINNKIHPDTTKVDSLEIFNKLRNVNFNITQIGIYMSYVMPLDITILKNREVIYF